jgi:hypothetical protein
MAAGRFLLTIPASSSSHAFDGLVRQTLQLEALCPDEHRVGKLVERRPIRLRVCPDPDRGCEIPAVRLEDECVKKLPRSVPSIDARERRAPPMSSAVRDSRCDKCATVDTSDKISAWRHQVSSWPRFAGVTA